MLKILTSQVWTSLLFHNNGTFTIVRLCSKMKSSSNFEIESQIYVLYMNVWFNNLTWNMDSMGLLILSKLNNWGKSWQFFAGQIVTIIRFGRDFLKCYVKVSILKCEGSGSHITELVIKIFYSCPVETFIVNKTANLLSPSLRKNNSSEGIFRKCSSQTLK